jgi:hypothetical protein
MKRYKSIDEVIRKGQIEVNGPVAIIMFGIPIIAILVAPIIIPKEYVGISTVAGLFLGFILAWLWWSYRIVKWRIWAFENTEKSDWQKLKERAINQKLIWNDGSIFEKTEIRSREENQKILEINSKVNQVEINKKEDELSLNAIEDDPLVPSQIDYYYKRVETIMSLVLPIILSLLGIYLIGVDQILIGAISIIMAFYQTNLNRISDVWKKEVQFSIGNNGINFKNLSDLGFVIWEDTQDISVDIENGIFKLDVWRDETLFEVTLNLNEYQIGDYEEFLRKINIYLKRKNEE